MILYYLEEHEDEEGEQDALEYMKAPCNPSRNHCSAVSCMGNASRLFQNVGESRQGWVCSVASLSRSRSSKHSQNRMANASPFRISLHHARGWGGCAREVVRWKVQASVTSAAQITPALRNRAHPSLPVRCTLLYAHGSCAGRTGRTLKWHRDQQVCPLSAQLLDSGGWACPYTEPPPTGSCRVAALLISSRPATTTLGFVW